MKVKGKLIFSPENRTRKHARQAEWKQHALINLNCDMAEYYAWFIKKRYNVILNKPLRGTHVTIISDIVPDVELFRNIAKELNSKECEFEFDINVRTNGEHWWLRVESSDAENIREACGLSRKPYFNFHLTVGNAAPRLDVNGNEMGGSNLEHSMYIYNCIKKFEYDRPRQV